MRGVNGKPWANTEARYVHYEVTVATAVADTAVKTGEEMERRDIGRREEFLLALIAALEQRRGR